MSARKIRRVAELIKGRPVEEALNILNYTPKAAAEPLAKTVKAAAANAIASVGTAKLKAEDLSVTRVFVDGGPTAKRVRFQSMGRAHRIRKRYCHLTVEVEGEPEPETPRARKGGRKKAVAEVATDETAEKTSKGRTRKARAKKETAPAEAEEKTVDIDQANVSADAPETADDETTDNKTDK
nr:50S ribosomal protein L22 [candidate division Zixibacteria bacterium]